MANNVVEQTEQLVQPIMEELNLELVDVEYVKEGKSWYLRVFVDKEGGVDIEECGRVSELLSEKLDETDPIKDMYYLEVSSPGAERPLKKTADFTKFVGSHVHIKLYEPIGGMKAIEGQLVAFSNEEVATIEYKDKARTKTIEIPYKKMAKARLAVSFN
ncbi:ribosome maturation factor RimP [Streptohalobacillus salinus]|uniref:Ribosome maturation factor RimP n=1 Tax=Streptohalobacillus salinus TaxID=621096 RepID=A0A2V3WDB0_9BACI|nr:ribosome maturation factor RimP [Streptohalobacillus salinus]PXW92493.1 ribosome maturation factor RimP [Streptohalobacillus salinus]